MKRSWTESDALAKQSAFFLFCFAAIAPRNDGFFYAPLGNAIDIGWDVVLMEPIESERECQFIALGSM